MQPPLDCNQVVAPPPTFVEFTIQDCEHCIPVHFERQVEKHLNRLAIKTPRQTLTYGALNESANRIAHAILKRRGREQEPVAVLLAKDIPLVSALLGILKANKIYASIDTSYPAERIKYLLQDLSPGLVLTDTIHSPLLNGLLQSGCTIMNLDELENPPSLENPALPIGLHNMACITFTSGTTGKPKGVAYDHDFLMHAIRRYTNSLRLCSQDRLGLLSSTAHAAVLKDVLRILLNGAMLSPYDVKESGLADLPDWLNEEQITIYHSIPMVFRRMLENCPEGYSFPHMRIIHLGGGGVYLRDVKLYKEFFPDQCTLVINLGCTEADNYCQFSIKKDSLIQGNLVPVGYPVSDQQVLLLNEHGEEVAQGDVGEIVVKSEHLAVGYWRNPDLTQAVFLAEPSGGPARLYHTGDLGRRQANGCMEYLGRRDTQVKIRGHRVELAEVEAALLSLDGIREGTVVTREDASGEAQLVAYIVPSCQPAPTVGALRRALYSQMPEYMIPSAFVWLDHLPLSPNGKIDSRALPPPGRTRPNLETTFAAPRNTTEENLAEIWACLLGLDQVGIDDNFFELGGHSLRATLVISRVRDLYQVEVPLQALFEAPTIAGFAQTIDQAIAKNKGKPISKITPLARQTHRMKRSSTGNLFK